MLQHWASCTSLLVFDRVDPFVFAGICIAPCRQQVANFQPPLAANKMFHCLFTSTQGTRKNKKQLLATLLTGQEHLVSSLQSFATSGPTSSAARAASSTPLESIALTSSATDRARFATGPAVASAYAPARCTPEKFSNPHQPAHHGLQLLGVVVCPRQESMSFAVVVLPAALCVHRRL